MAARILVVDDDREDRTSVAKELSDYDVTGVTNGDEALELLEVQKFDITILDAQTPDGWETLRIVKDAWNGYETKVIMVSDNPDPDEFMKSCVIGADSFLSKPFDSISLRRLVRESLVE